MINDKKAMVKNTKRKKQTLPEILLFHVERFAKLACKVCAQ